MWLTSIGAGVSANCAIGLAAGLQRVGEPVSRARASLAR